MRRRYITENALLEREGKKKEKKEGRRLQFLPSLKAFATKHQRTKEKENQSSDKARLPPNDSIIPSPYDHVRLLELSLKPSSWTHFLYQIYCIGLVGFGLICLTVKNLPKVDPTISIGVVSSVKYHNISKTIIINSWSPISPKKICHAIFLIYLNRVKKHRIFYLSFLKMIQ